MKKGNKIFIGLVSAALIGAISSLLFVSKKGRENREVLKGHINRIRDKMRRNRGAGEMQIQGTFLSRNTNYLP